MTRWIALAAALLGACGAPPDHYDLILDESLGAQAAPVESAAREWSGRAPGLNLDIAHGRCGTDNPSPGGNRVCVRVDHGQPPECPGAPGETTGCTSRKTWEDAGHDGLVVLYDLAIIEFDPEHADGLFRTAALHELGHAWGLVHTDPGTVMCPSLLDAPDWQTGGRVTDDDVVQFLAVHSDT